MRLCTIVLAIVLAAAPGAAGEPGSAAPAARPVATIEDVRHQVSLTSDIDAFVAWLKQRANVSDVHLGPVLLTSLPPQQWVDFTLDANRHRFTLAKGFEGKVLIVREDVRPAK